MVISVSVEIQLAVLDAQVAQTKAQAIKHSTKRNILAHITAYQQFCEIYNLQMFPADNKQICRFGQYLMSVRKFKSPDSIGNYQSGVRTCHAILGFKTPNTQDKEMQWFIQGIQRLLVNELKQAEPITPQLLMRMSTVVKYTDHTEMVAWVAVLLGFTMFMRKSNLVPESKDKFDGEQQFKRSDINIIHPFKVMMGEVRWSKTNQFKKRILRVPILATTNKAICPVMWTHYMINTIRAEPQDPLFTIFSEGQKKALSASMLLTRLRRWLTLIKEEAEAYSLHSLRRGGATFAYQCKIEDRMIQLLGDWASSAYKRYIDVNIDDRYETMQAFVEGLNKVTA